jgi:putative copper resistance protein D
MSSGYWVTVTLHVLAALVWLGGMFFLALVGAPVLRRVEPPALRAQLFRDLGYAFRRVGWVTLAVLVASGTLLLHYRGWLGVLGSRGFWATTAGMALAWKLGAVATMLLVQAAHDFALGPSSSRAALGSAESNRLRRRAALLARASALIGLVIVLAAVRLARS